MAAHVDPRHFGSKVVDRPAAYRGAQRSFTLQRSFSTVGDLLRQDVAAVPSVRPLTSDAPRPFTPAHGALGARSRFARPDANVNSLSCDSPLPAAATTPFARAATAAVVAYSPPRYSSGYGVAQKAETQRTTASAGQFFNTPTREHVHKGRRSVGNTPGSSVPRDSMASGAAATVAPSAASYVPLGRKYLGVPTASSGGNGCLVAAPRSTGAGASARPPVQVVAATAGRRMGERSAVQRSGAAAAHAMKLKTPRRAHHADVAVMPTPRGFKFQGARYAHTQRHVNNLRVGNVGSGGESLGPSNVVASRTMLKRPPAEAVGRTISKKTLEGVFVAVPKAVDASYRPVAPFA